MITFKLQVPSRVPSTEVEVFSKQLLLFLSWHPLAMALCVS